MKKYYQLTKPGIIFGNLMTAAGGFALASRHGIDGSLLFFMLIGTALIVASSCVFNNYMDRFADQKMNRTKMRALATGVIPVKNAILFGISLAVLGVAVLGFFTNFLALFLALLGMFVYLILYTILKYKTVQSTLIGSIAGAMPPLVGYAAASNRLDIGALLIFLILVFWQMPHFFAIAIYRIEEYAAAAVHVLPLKRGMYATKVQMFLYVVAFLVAATLPTLFGFTGYIYLAVALSFGTAWLYISIQGFKAENDKKWARKMFLFSVQIIALLSIMIPIDATH